MQTDKKIKVTMEDASFNQQQKENVVYALSKTTLPVVQANELVFAKQSFDSIYSYKLIRLVISQCTINDYGFYQYVIPISDFGSLINTAANNLYSSKAKQICDDINRHPLLIRKLSRGRKKDAWTEIPWVAECTYEPAVGIVIELNKKLEPLLLNLRQNFLSMDYLTIKDMRSVYALRMFELICARYIGSIDNIPRGGVWVEITLKEIIDALDLHESSQTWDFIKRRIIEPCVNNVRQTTVYDIAEIKPQRKGRSVYSVRIHFGFKGFV